MSDEPASTPDPEFELEPDESSEELLESSVLVELLDESSDEPVLVEVSVEFEPSPTVSVVVVDEFVLVSVVVVEVVLVVVDDVVATVRRLRAAFTCVLPLDRVPDQYAIPTRTSTTTVASEERTATRVFDTLLLTVRRGGSSAGLARKPYRRRGTP